MAGIPAGFLVLQMDWISQNQGWAVVETPAKTLHLFQTTDEGRRWSAAPLSTQVGPNR